MTVQDPFDCLSKSHGLKSVEFYRASVPPGRALLSLSEFTRIDVAECCPTPLGVLPDLYGFFVRSLQSTSSTLPILREMHPYF